VAARRGDGPAGPALQADRSASPQPAAVLALPPAYSRCLRTGLTFSAVCFAWIFFRAASLSDALYIISHLFSGLPAQVEALFMPDQHAAATLPGKVALLLAAGLFIWKEEALLRVLEPQAFPRWFRWGLYYLLLVLIFLFGNQQTSQFIYFQF
jgi:alginate O-acetyltransferase complex protein AlgI